MSFGDDVEKWANETAIEQITKVYRAASLETFGAIISGTPVGNAKLWKTTKPQPGYTGGTLRASWTATINTPSQSVPEGAKGSASAITKKAASVVERADLTDDIYLSNNQPYADRVEFEGWSTQAPAGMVRVNVARFSRLINKAARKFNK